MITLLLSERGLLPSTVADLVSARKEFRRAAAEKEPFSLILLDSAVANSESVELVQARQSADEWASVPIVFCAALGQCRKEVTGGGNEMRVDAVLTKPIRRHELWQTLGSLLDGERVPATKDTEVAPVLLSAACTQARVLVVDDNLTNQQVAAGLLKRLGLRAEIAGGGEDAIRMLEKTSFDLVLMDLQMPDLDGFETTRRIRDLKSPVLNHQVPIIALTASASPSDRRKCQDVGMDDYLSKPIEVSTLVATLEMWLNRPRSDRAARSAAVGRIEGESAVGLRVPAAGFGGKPVFDRGALLSRVMNDSGLARALVSGFLGDMPVQIAKLQSYADSGQVELIKQQAHQIKGASGTVGGEALRAAAATLEHAGRAGDATVIAEQIAELETQFSALKSAMQKEL
jgi:CheY-like chemotaxis protein/HPt (histidine-containing phosphotransfer) domain-containing protein